MWRVVDERRRQCRCSRRTLWTAFARIDGICSAYCDRTRFAWPVSIRHRLSQAAAPTGKLLANFCPAFAPIATSTIEPEPLSFGFARDRLETLLARVFAALSPAEPPVVFFLRHAARADAATLRSLSRVLAHAETRQIAVIALIDVLDKPQNENAWRAFVGNKKYVIERFDFDVRKVDHHDSEPKSGTVATVFAPDTRQTIEAMSCCGQAEVNAVAAALQISPQDAMNQMLVAVEAGVLRRQGGAYAFVDPLRARDCHDGIDPQLRGQMHLRIGRFYASDRSRSPVPQTQFVVAAQLVAAVQDDALVNSDEPSRTQIAELLLDAARKAMVMAAHDVAAEYLEAAVRLLAPRGDIWSEASSNLATRIEFARLECACAAGDRLGAKTLFDKLRERVPNAPEMPAAWNWLIELQTRSNDHKRAVECAGEALAKYGIHLEAQPGADAVKQAFEGVWEALGDRAIEEIYDLEPMTNPTALEATELLFAVHASAQALGAGPADLVACHLSRLALVYGNAKASSVGHASFGAAIIGRQKDHRTGTRFGKVALQLCEQQGMNRHYSAVAMKFAVAMSIWTHPLQSSIDHCTRTYEVAMACGDGRAATRLAAMIPFLALLQGTSLDEVCDEALRRRRAIRSQGCDDEGMGDLCDTIERFVGQQKGRTAQRRSKSGILTDELRLGHVACRVVDLISLVLTHEYEAALFVSSHLSKSIANLGSLILVSEYWFWSMLAATSTRTSGLPDQLGQVIDDFDRWADRCPQTFQHKHALLTAERARLEGRDMDAMRAYDQAITEARENGFTQLEALAAEMASRFYSTRDFPLIAGTYFRTARNAYGRWGAASKVLQIDRRYPKLSGTTEQSPSSPPPSMRNSSDLDLYAAVKVAQTVSKEIVLQRLLVTLMKIVAEHVTAERCHVLLEFEDGELNHAGKAVATSKGLEIEVPGPLVKSIGDILPASIIEHVRSTHESVCLDEAVADRTWADDPYIASNRPRSVVCFPIMRQSTIVGMFYLENNAARGIFTPRRLALLEFLANQAAISLEHAKLYADLARENTERRRAEQVLRDKIDIIERQKNNIRALSTPLLDVAEGIVAMPVLGELDEDRASRIMDVLLDTITKRNIRSAILDLTGVSSIGNATAEQIGRIVRAVELVGARAIVAGIRADVARAIISLDVGLGRIETRASMKDALRVLVQNAPTSQTVRKNQSRSSR
jgi:GAF domain-containing protein/tetratricopeptide (TPR) repeat protein